MTENDKQKLNVFLCHASGDKDLVRSLYRKLLHEVNIEPWLDQENLFPGQKWDLEIRKAVSRADVILVCLSKQSVNKEGYVQKEIKLALDVADEKLEDEIFLIPVKLEECDVPARLSSWHWLNYFEKDAYDKLLQSLQKRADHFGIEISNELPRRKRTGHQTPQPHKNLSPQSGGVFPIPQRNNSENGLSPSSLPSTDRGNQLQGKHQIPSEATNDWALNQNKEIKLDTGKNSNTFFTYKNILIMVGTVGVVLLIGGFVGLMTFFSHFDETILIVSIVSLVIGGTILAVMAYGEQDKCPKCGKFWAREETARAQISSEQIWVAKQVTDKIQTDEGKWTEVTKTIKVPATRYRDHCKYRCKYCGHKWKGEESYEQEN